MTQFYSTFKKGLCSFVGFCTKPEKRETNGIFARVLAPQLKKVSKQLTDNILPGYYSQQKTYKKDIIHQSLLEVQKKKKK